MYNAKTCLIINCNLTIQPLSRGEWLFATGRILETNFIFSTSTLNREPLNPEPDTHSYFNDFTGFEVAALID